MHDFFRVLTAFIQKKFYFCKYLQCYPIAIDGTGKFSRNWLWSENCLEKNKKNKDEMPQKQYHVYVLEANLAFQGGTTIPLMSEILSYSKGDIGNDKQDCELRAFYRLSERLKKYFPKLKIMLLIDGLYAKGPVVEICRKNQWQFMIVLKDKALPSVMQEYKVLSELEKENKRIQNWGNREQAFKWVNDIEYHYGTNGKSMQKVHVVECKEQWKEVDHKTGEIVEKGSRHVWLSSNALNRDVVHERCNLGARSRWGIESGNLVEKHHGYQYEHCFSYSWNAMKGFHYLMRLGHFLNVLAIHSKALAKFVKDTGIRGLIRFIRETIAAPWLDYAWMTTRLAQPFQLRLLL